MRTVFHQLLGEQLKKAFRQVFDLELSEVNLEQPPTAEYGDVSFACFSYARQLKRSPAAIAALIAPQISLQPYLSAVKLAGGYVNFFFKSAPVTEKLLSDLAAGTFGELRPAVSKRILIEFSAPNANKPLHLGHGRNNALGLFLVRIAKMLGHEVFAVNLINDRGVHICKSMLAYQLQGKGATPASTGKKGDHFVGDYYVLFSKLAKQDASLEQKAQQLLLSWEQSDPLTTKLWRKMTDWVLAGFKQTYNRAGIEFDRFYYESETYRGGKQIIEQALKNGLCYREENGAIAISLADQGLDNKVLQRGDGTSVYITQDIKTSIQKIQDYKAEEAYWVVGSEQEHHFRVLFAILKKLGYSWAENCAHVSYGMITLPDGKMKSREGKTVDLDLLYDDLQKAAYDLIVEKNPADQRSKDELLAVADLIGQAAVNFFMFKSSSNKDIVFDRQKSLSFDGMTGPYLQYTYARISSLLKKAGSPQPIALKLTASLNAEEWLLVKTCAFYAATVQSAWAHKNPAIIAHYCYELCRLFNKFYNLHPVLQSSNSEQRQLREQLALLSAFVLERCFYLMNISALAKM